MGRGSEGALINGALSTGMRVKALPVLVAGALTALATPAAQAQQQAAQMDFSIPAQPGPRLALVLGAVPSSGAV